MSATATASANVGTRDDAYGARESWLKAIGKDAKLLLIGIPVALWTILPIYHMFLFAISPKLAALLLLAIPLMIAPIALMAAPLRAAWRRKPSLLRVCNARAKPQAGSPLLNRSRSVAK